MADVPPPAPEPTPTPAWGAPAPAPAPAAEAPTPTPEPAMVPETEAPTPAPAPAPAPAPMAEAAVPEAVVDLAETAVVGAAVVEVAVEVPVVEAEEETPLETAETAEAVDKVLDEFENMKIFGNKSLEELQLIQSRKSHLSAGILFTDPSLKIPPPILESLTLEMRFEKPSEIQASTLPLILDRHNVIAQAQSGAGKTIAFVIGMLAAIDPHSHTCQALCLTPTRELANQILSDAVRPLSSRLTVTYEEGLPGREVPRGAVCASHIVVGTPGTVKRWVKMGYLPLDRVRVFVLDEADKMVEERSLGADTIAIRKKLPNTCQILFFSATYGSEIIALARQLVPRAFLVTPRSTEELVLDVIFQVRMDVTKCQGGKLQVLKDIYDFMTVQQSIVFVEMRREADNVAGMMRQGGFEVSTLHGELSPQDRDRVMADFRAGRTKVLITTNALARGVDVPAVAVVVNYDLPVTRMGNRLVGDEATYLHRIGRCGRFGRRGTAINFLEKSTDFDILSSIEKHYSPDKPMTTEWDATDIEGLSDAIRARPEGGEIAPAAKGGNAAVNVSIFN
eukprot:CAMPEP_0173235146 /NCGR_PEP_ID=MMETSP1142-20121109/10667_1 /TAXON_ID=483371 /ORGANISM="non described non described, Strain CCMP2298" /LENGTH=563 /DNA_ID=CAMNT_0014165361 /DNA_START=31 /DNA_END=1722 /DNA_ORIENTATION=-